MTLEKLPKSVKRYWEPYRVSKAVVVIIHLGLRNGTHSFLAVRLTLMLFCAWCIDLASVA